MRTAFCRSHTAPSRPDAKTIGSGGKRVESSLKGLNSTHSTVGFRLRSSGAEPCNRRGGRNLLLSFRTRRRTSSHPSIPTTVPYCNKHLRGLQRTRGKHRAPSCMVSYARTIVCPKMAGVVPSTGSTLTLQSNQPSGVLVANRPAMRNGWPVGVAGRTVASGGKSEGKGR